MTKRKEPKPEQISLPAVFDAHSGDDRPLPEIIIEQLGGHMDYVDTVDDKRLYCVRDWIYEISGSQNEQRAVPWSNLKAAIAKKDGTKVFEIFKHLTVKTPGGMQSTEFADAAGLYLITQYMSNRTSTIRGVKQYLADCGVFVDEIRKDPHGGAEVIQAFANDKDYRKLIADGFSPEEAQQWIINRQLGKDARKRLTAAWQQHGVTEGKDYAKLTNTVNEVALGDTATRQKRDMQLRPTASLRDYISAADLAMLEVTESLSIGLHTARNSDGTEELTEDVLDTESMINRDEVYRQFSKKRRRLPGGK